MKRSSAELKRMAREILTGHYGVPMGAAVVGTLIPALINLPFSLMFKDPSSVSQMITYYLASFIISLISIILGVGLVKLHLNMARKQPYQFTHLFWGFSNHPEKYVLAYLLLIVILLVPMIPGMVLLIVGLIQESVVLDIIAIALFILALVAIIYLSLTYGMVMYLLADAPEARVLDAFHESKRLMTGNRGRYFYLSLSFIGWILLGVCSCYIGFLWIIPYINQTNTMFYLDLSGGLKVEEPSFDARV